MHNLFGQGNSSIDNKSIPEHETVQNTYGTIPEDEEMVENVNSNSFQQSPKPRGMLYLFSHSMHHLFRRSSGEVENGTPKLVKKAKNWSMVVERMDSIVVDTPNSEIPDHIPLDYTLLECLGVVFLYVFLGIVSYSFLVEDWSIADSVYFTVVTVTTVGYGDISPETDFQRMFTSLFALVGVGFIGVALGMIGDNIITANEKALAAAKGNSVARIMKVFDVSEHDENEPLTELTSTTDETSSYSFGKNFLYVLIAYLLPTLAILFIGAIFIAHFEGWNLCVAFYYLIVTSTTIGYGDFAPQNEATRWFASLFILLGVGTMGTILGKTANLVIESRRSRLFQQLKCRELHFRDLLEMDTDDDGQVSMLEYIEFILVTMEKVDRDLLNDIRAQFMKLDVSESGYITRQDLKNIAKKKLRTARKKLELSQYKNHITAVGHK